MRPLLTLAFLLTAPAMYAQQTLPDAPSQLVAAADADSSTSISTSMPVAASAVDPSFSLYPAGYEPQTANQQTAAQAASQSDKPKRQVEVDANGNPIPLNRQQPKRILGFMPNFRTVSAGAVVPPPTWKYNFTIARKQALDYSSFIFLGLTTLSAEYITDAHPSLDKGSFPLYAYLWRGFLDKTDGTFLGGFLLPSLLHQDNRYYPLGNGHKVVTRIGYVISRQAVTRTYGGHQTFNISGLGGKALTQYISRFYYPANSSGFSVLATKFAYSAMRDIAFSSIREFYPDIAAHYVRKHREKVAQQSARDVNATQPAKP